MQLQHTSIILIPIWIQEFIVCFAEQIHSLSDDEDRNGLMIELIFVSFYFQYVHLVFTLRNNVPVVLRAKQVKDMTILFCSSYSMKIIENLSIPATYVAIIAF